MYAAFEGSIQCPHLQVYCVAPFVYVLRAGRCPNKCPPHRQPPSYRVRHWRVGVKYAYAENANSVFVFAAAVHDE